MLKKYPLALYSSGKKGKRVAMDLFTCGNLGEILLPPVARF